MCISHTQQWITTLKGVSNMPLQAIYVPDRGQRTLVDLTKSDDASVLANIKPMKVARVALVAGLANSFNFNWQNPESVEIMIINLVINVSVAGTAGADIDAGTAAATGTHSDNLLDGQDIGSTGWLNSFTNQATNGRCSQLMNEKGGATDWICGQSLLQNCPNLAGYAYIYYMLLA